MLGSAIIVFAYNVRYDIAQREVQAIIMGTAFGVVSLIFGNVNNGGHFNPAITIAVLMQRYEEGNSRKIQGFFKILENTKFAFLCIVS